MPKIKYNPFFILWHTLKNDVHKLESDPRAQYQYHTVMTRYWAMNFPVIILLFFCLPKLWIAIALFINTMYSLYANLATDFGAVPSACAAMKAGEIQSAQMSGDKSASPAVDTPPEELKGFGLDPILGGERGDAGRTAGRCLR